MSLSNEGFDILQAHDKAGRKSSDDPVVRMLRNALLNGKGKYDGSKDKAIDILAEITRIAACLADVSPAHAAAWNGRMKRTTGTGLIRQEHEAMVETARKMCDVRGAQPRPRRRATTGHFLDAPASPEISRGGYGKYYGILPI
jgi:hypothetical protein